MLKAKGTTDTFFKIGRIILSIDDDTFHLTTAYWYIWSPQKVYE